MAKRLGGIIGCKYKPSSWHSNGFPDGSNIGSTVQCWEEDASTFTEHENRQTSNLTPLVLERAYKAVDRLSIFLP